VQRHNKVEAANKVCNEWAWKRDWKRTKHSKRWLCNQAYTKTAMRLSKATRRNQKRQFCKPRLPTPFLFTSLWFFPPCISASKNWWSPWVWVHSTSLSPLPQINKSAVHCVNSASSLVPNWLLDTLCHWDLFLNWWPKTTSGGGGRWKQGIGL